MNNFSVEFNGHTFWISRSIAVVGFVYGYDNDDNEYILAVQRGTGTPDPEFVGCWCLPCGYLDYDETIEEALKREVFEETGLTLKDSYFMNLLDVNSDPKSDKRQNVTFRYEYIVQEPIIEIKLTAKNSEKDEVADIKWIPTDKIDNYKWAFNHNKLIKYYNE